MIPPLSPPFASPLQPIQQCQHPFLANFATIWWQLMSPTSEIFWAPNYDNYPTLRIICAKLPDPDHIKQCLAQLGHAPTTYTMANLHRTDSNYERSFAITFPWQPQPAVLLFALAYLPIKEWECRILPLQNNYRPYFQPPRPVHQVPLLKKTNPSTLPPSHSQVKEVPAFPSDDSEITSSSSTSSLPLTKESEEPPTSPSKSEDIEPNFSPAPAAICVIKSPQEILSLGDKNTGVTVQITDWSQVCHFSNEKKAQIGIWVLKNHSIDFPMLWEQIKTYPKIFPKLLPELKGYFENKLPLTDELTPLFIECITHDKQLILKDIWTATISNDKCLLKQELFNAGSIYKYDEKGYANVLAKLLQDESIDWAYYLKDILIFISHMDKKEEIAEKTISLLNETNISKACKNLLPFLQNDSKTKLNKLLAPQSALKPKEIKAPPSQVSPISMEKYLKNLRENLYTRPITRKERIELKAKCENHIFNENELKQLIRIEQFRNYPEPADLEILKPIWKQVLEAKNSHFFWILACYFTDKKNFHPPHILKFIQEFAPQIVELINEAIMPSEKENESQVNELDGLITFTFQFNQTLALDKTASFSLFKKNLLTYISTEYPFPIEEQRFLYTSTWMLNWLSSSQNNDLTEDDLKLRDLIAIKTYSSIARFIWNGTFENHLDVFPGTRSLWAQFVNALPTVFPLNGPEKIFLDYTELHASTTSKEGVLVTDQATLLCNILYALLKSKGNSALSIDRPSITGAIIPILFLRINQVQTYLFYGKKELKGDSLVTLNEQMEELSILSQNLLLLSLKNKLYRTFKDCFLGTPSQQFEMLVFYLSICIKIEPQIDFDSLNEFLTNLPTLSKTNELSLNVKEGSPVPSLKLLMGGLSIVLAMQKVDESFLELFSNVMKEFAKTTTALHFVSSILYATISHITKKPFTDPNLPRFLSILFSVDLPKNLLLQNGIDILTPLLSPLRDNPDFWTEELESKYQKTKPKDIYALEELLKENPPDFAAIKSIHHSFKQEIPVAARQQVRKTGALLLKVATDKIKSAEAPDEIQSCFSFLQFLEKFHKELPSDPLFLDRLPFFAQTVWTSRLNLDPYAVAQWLLSWPIQIDKRGKILNQILVHAAIPFWPINLNFPVVLKSHVNTLLQIIEMSEAKSAPLLKPFVNFIAAYEKIETQIATSLMKKEAITEALHKCIDEMTLYLSEMEPRDIDSSERANFTILFRLLAHIYFQNKCSEKSLSKSTQFFKACITKGIFQKLEDLILLDQDIDPTPLLMIWYFTKEITSKIPQDLDALKPFSLIAPEHLEKKDSTLGLISLMFELEKFSKTLLFINLKKQLTPFLQKTEENGATELDLYIFRKLIAMMNPQTISVNRETFARNYKSALLFFLCTVQNFPVTEQALLWQTLEGAKKRQGDLWPKELDPQIKKLGKKP